MSLSIKKFELCSTNIWCSEAGLAGCWLCRRVRCRGSVCVHPALNAPVLITTKPRGPAPEPLCVAQTDQSLSSAAATSRKNQLRTLLASDLDDDLVSAYLPCSMSQDAAEAALMAQAQMRQNAGRKRHHHHVVSAIITMLCRVPRSNHRVFPSVHLPLVSHDAAALHGGTP